MFIFEVIFWGTRDLDKAKHDYDTIYLVRAPDYRSAVELVATNASKKTHPNGERTAHIVFEIGKDLSNYPNAQILRGPYYACAYNFGWRAWHRKIDGSNYTREWEEGEIGER
jgi:hypothetical protein